jgi:hypothetical protein
MDRSVTSEIGSGLEKAPASCETPGLEYLGGPPEGGRRHLPINQKHHHKAQKLSVRKTIAEQQLRTLASELGQHPWYWPLSDPPGPF